MAREVGGKELGLWRTSQVLGGDLRALGNHGRYLGTDKMSYAVVLGD